MLGRRIGAKAFVAALAGGGGDGDDPAPAALGHGTDDMANGQHDTFDVDRMDTAPVVKRDLPDQGSLSDPRICNQDIDRAMLGLCQRHDLGDFVFVGHVHGTPMDRAAGPRQFLQRGNIDPGDGYGGTCIDQRPGRSRADARAATGHEGVAPAQHDGSVSEE